MFKKNDLLFYIDTIEGCVIKGKFIDYDGKDMWIKLPNEAMNTFVYSDKVSDIVFEKQEAAQIQLEAIRQRLRIRLQNKTVFIEELTSKIHKHEGRLYAEVVKEILLGKNFD
jgi:hypothetical protein